MKSCRECKKNKAEDQFHKNKTKVDGLCALCKDCQNKYMRAWINKNPERRKQIARKWAVKNPQAAVKTVQKFYRRNPDKWIARNAVRTEIRAGRFTRPLACEKCRTAGEVEGHHADYSRRLDVIWLCSRCHAEVHKEEKWWRNQLVKSRGEHSSVPSPTPSDAKLPQQLLMDF